MLAWPNLGLLLKRGIVVITIPVDILAKSKYTAAAAILGWAMPAAPDLVCGLSLW